jgi:coenzyme F420-dependent glucose-6-phosphate dehydrogenase
MQTPELRRGTVGYACDLDVIEANTMLDYASLARKSSFDAIWVFDHFHPWHHTNATESHAWIWMSTALERINSIPMGTAVTAPILRYHPALIAQAFATMQKIYGSRVILGVGTGEAMNEVPLGFPWPPLKERRERLIEAVTIIRRLCSEEFVDFSGKYFTLKSANMYMRADFPIYIAAMGPKMAEVAGRLGDGFITSNQPPQHVKSVLMPAIRDGVKSAGKEFDAITKVTELDISYDEDLDKALASAKRLGASFTPEAHVAPIADPREIEKLDTTINEKQLLEKYAISNSPEDHIKKIEACFQSGFDHVYIYSVSPNERKAIEMYRDEILPYFSAKVGEKKKPRRT